MSLSYLTKSFVSSVFIYAQNPSGFRTEYTKAATDAPLLFSAFKYNVGFWPLAKVAQVGNLVRYQSKLNQTLFKNCSDWRGQEDHPSIDSGWMLIPSADHDFGGHFPGLDNPPALLEDLREIATYWV